MYLHTSATQYSPVILKAAKSPFKGGKWTTSSYVSSKDSEMTHRLKTATTKTKKKQGANSIFRLLL